MVLPLGTFNSTIAIPLQAYPESFITVAATVSPIATNIATS